mmetsp:Transcript_88902/g.241074  ORF Transcript_88902/g.241074 Transcript_88902/m.241074 type:complete len:349 (+) Transcript_88902:484-1530(+)
MERLPALQEPGRLQVPPVDDEPLWPQADRQRSVHLLPRSGVADGPAAARRVRREPTPRRQVRLYFGHHPACQALRLRLRCADAEPVLGHLHRAAVRVALAQQQAQPGSYGCSREAQPVGRAEPGARPKDGEALAAHVQRRGLPLVRPGVACCQARGLHRGGFRLAAAALPVHRRVGRLRGALRRGHDGQDLGGDARLEQPGPEHPGRHSRGRAGRVPHVRHVGRVRRPRFVEGGAEALPDALLLSELPVQPSGALHADDIRGPAGAAGLELPLRQEVPVRRGRQGRVRARDPRAQLARRADRPEGPTPSAAVPRLRRRIGRAMGGWPGHLRAAALASILSRSSRVDAS